MFQKHAGNLSLLIIGALLFHGSLLPFTHGATYDAYIHMFFADHYHRSWFDPWEPRWYTGFSLTSYPPAAHMLIAFLFNFMPLRAAFVVATLMAITILVIGFYRYANIFVSARVAFLAALLLILSGSVSETVHIFGQLPTIASLGIFLNAMPHIYRWLLLGRYSELGAAIAIAAGATSVHHVTTIFGSVFFIGSLALYAWITHFRALEGPLTFKARTLYFLSLPLWRGCLLGVLMIGAVILTIFPYWYWSLTDPITQLSIPHGSRENFLKRVDLGIAFFVIPWGVGILLLPYIIYKGLTTRLFPFMAALMVCFVLGTGGTTPLPEMILRGAFHILTLDRFTFWATMLALPFAGLFLEGLIWGRSGKLVEAALGRMARGIFPIAIIAAYGFFALFVSIQSTFRHLQPKAIDPEPIVKFMASDNHDSWRYLTLGFGDQFAYISAQMSALSIDGNYHSARRLPNFTRYSVERLENAKYLGVGGIGSLQQFLINADDYHLKYVFSNDAFYDPLLYMTGWNRIVRLPNNIVVWEKQGIRALPSVLPRKNFPLAHVMMWHILPPTAFCLALILILSSMRRIASLAPHEEMRSAPLTKTRYQSPAVLRFAARQTSLIITLFALGALGLLILILQRLVNPGTPQQAVEHYLEALGLHDFAGAYSTLDPNMRPEYAEYHFSKMWAGGLLASFGKLTEIKTEAEAIDESIVDVKTHASYLTALGMQEEERIYRAIRREDGWYVIPDIVQPVQSVERIQRKEGVEFNITGRRQPLFDPDLHRDIIDYPQLALDGLSLVEQEGRYSVIGLLTNIDVDPLLLNMQGELYDEEERSLITGHIGIASPFRLLPGESAPFRIDFEGRLSLEDAKRYAGFDPSIYIPPILENEPAGAKLRSTALATEAGLYRDFTIARITHVIEGGELVIRGELINNGLHSIAMAKLLAGFYDEAARVRWVAAGFSRMIVRPGQMAPFEIRAPLAGEVEIIAPIGADDIDVNFNAGNDLTLMPGRGDASLSLGEMGGYSALRFYVDPMIHDEVF